MAGTDMFTPNADASAFAAPSMPSKGFSHDAAPETDKFSTAMIPPQLLDGGHAPNYHSLKVHQSEAPTDSRLYVAAPTNQAPANEWSGGKNVSPEMLRGDIDMMHRNPGHAQFDTAFNRFTQGPISDMTPGKFTPYEPGQAPVAIETPRMMAQQRQEQIQAGITGAMIANASRGDGGADGNPTTGSAEEQNRARNSVQQRIEQDNLAEQQRLDGAARRGRLWAKNDDSPRFM